MEIESYENLSSWDEQTLVTRPLIRHMIQNTFLKPVVTVVASAGYGKTQAVWSALEEAGQPYMWLQMTELDNRVGRLWERILFTIGKLHQGVAQELLSLGFPESQASFYKFLSVIESAIPYKEQRFVLVVDDFHLLHDPDVLAFFENIVLAQIHNICVVFIARTKPKINLSGMFSKGLVVRITEDELRFTKDEMCTYFHKLGMELQDELLSDLYVYSEGWIFAIHLLGISMQKGVEYSRNTIDLSKVDIFELMENDIFKNLSERIQIFLIKFAIIGTISTPILRALASEDVLFLSELTKTSMFVRYDAMTDQYRLHHLFQEFLCHKARRLGTAMIQEAYLLAASKYHEEDQLALAVDYYKKCGRYEEIFQIVMKIGEKISYIVKDSFIELIEQAPSTAIDAQPLIRVMHAAYLFDNNRIKEALQKMECMRLEYEALPKTQCNQEILGEVYLRLALLSIVCQNYLFEELFMLADACLPKGSVLIDKSLNIAAGINVTGIKEPKEGELDRYKEALFRATPYATRVMNGCAYGIDYFNAADSALMVGDLKSAEKNAYEAIYRALQYEQHGIVFESYFILVRIYVAKGDYTKIENIVFELTKKLETLHNSDCIYLFDVLVGWLYIKTGQVEKVAKWILHEDETKKILAPVIIGREHLVRSDHLLTQERYYELLAFMKSQDILYEERGILYALIQNKITRAIIHYYMNHHVESLRSLEEAYALSSPNHLIIQYIEYGNRMRTVINAARQDPTCQIPIEWLNMIYTKSSTYAKMLSKVAAGFEKKKSTFEKGTVSLSRKETEVLSKLCYGLTREEIALECNISSNTVKSMLQIIFDKLGAKNSIDAVRIATMQNLVQ